MLSKTKLTFSLTSIVVLIAFGLVCFAPSAFADGDAGKTHLDLSVKISAAESMIDVSHEGGDNDIQIATGRDRADRTFAGGDAVTITLLVEFSHVVTLDDPEAGLAADTADVQSVMSGGNFGADDIFIRAFDKDGRSLGEILLADVIAAGATEGNVNVLTQFRDAGAPGRQFLVRIDETQLTNAFVTLRGGGFEIYSLVFYIPVGIPKAATGSETEAGREERPGDLIVLRGIRKATLDHVTSHFDPDGPGDGLPHQHLNSQSNLFRVDLVDDDEGEAKYSTTLAATPLSGEGVPGIVTIDQLRERTGFIESGPFDVRLILTEEPKGGLTTDLIMVEGGGSATNVTKGATLKGAITATDPPGISRSSELTLAMASFVEMIATAPTGTLASLPEATGRDNLYHQYFVTIEPDGGVNGYITVSVKQFADNVKPISMQYIPLTPQQRAAVISTVATTARNARVANETLMVMVNTAADTTSAKALATAAYETRSDDDADDADGKGKNGVYDLNQNVKTIGSRLVVPADGYLVLVADVAKANIVASDAKLAQKELKPATKLYNTTGLGLPFPADDLDNFFRNGGSLSLIYQDLPAATGSGHDDAKAVAAAGHADDTGYTGATTNTYAAGALVINEIMWGLDAGGKDSQYIELHNPGTAAVPIDHLEWAIAVGTAPTGFTVIDAVSNNPATGYWAVPGNGGVTVASAAYPTVSDLVSMSRVTGGTDGTAAASWAASMRPGANLSGRRIGTPGAANIYVMPTVEAVEEAPAEVSAPVATGKDIMITEIMVASNDGRLPQWIEIANDSTAAVSLSGWSLEIDNDSADADVVGESVVIDLGDVEIGAGEVALVISKEGRNSGVDTAGVARVKGDANAGNLDADRIIDVKSQVSPTNARYSLISEMGFMISLIPPQTGAVRTPGDVVGNLGGGWELPMSEDGRSSLIRREMDDAAMATMGTDAAGWVLASDTLLSGAYRATYYGSDEDVGTPGFDAGGMLPVELSGFNAARDKVTGAVVITWATQSELNNAGFFIKRSQQQKGKFVVVNPTMIAGAGTTAEKQSYTYTDATADPNVIYYYQIEDVSLDGNRQTLTRAHRLKGHIGAAGKATTTWGELKSSRE